MGERFYEWVTLTKSAVETAIGTPKKGEPLTAMQQLVRDLELERVSATSVVPKT